MTVYYRSRAFQKDESDGLHFWTIDPVHDKPGQFYIRHHETGRSHRFSARISGDMTERDALRRLEALETEAAQKHRPAAESPENLRRMGDNYTEALPFREHPAHIAQARQNALARRPKPKFKP